jgi:DNA-binding PadR family transcriptional regulator
MYEFIILALLMRSPMHGYLIARIASDQIGPWAKISSGTLYTILAKLERVGLITLLSPQEPEQGGRQSRTYAITDAGRQRFHQLMLDTSSNLGEYQRWFYFKLVYFDLIRPEERMLLWNHYLTYCQTSALYLQSEAEALRHELSGEANSVFLAQALRVMTRMEQQWRAEVEWATEERAREAAGAHDTVEDSL